VRHVVPFLSQFWLFITPIAYPSSLLPESWQMVYGLNPMVGVVEGFRWALLGTNKGPSFMIALSVVVSLSLLTTGLFYFRRMEKHFADTV
jgi:lipopolysaccharide transport system permease protein